MGGSRCRMSIIRKGNVALSNLKQPCRPVEFKKQSCRPVRFKKQPCRMSLRPKKGRVAVSILGVHPPNCDIDCHSGIGMPVCVENSHGGL